MFYRIDFLYYINENGIDCRICFKRKPHTSKKQRVLRFKIRFSIKSAQVLNRRIIIIIYFNKLQNRRYEYSLQRTI